MGDVQTVTTYFRIELANAGYPIEEGKIGWSLSNCQGDGMDFKGIINGEELKPLAKRVLDPKEYQAFGRALKKTDFAGGIEIVKISSHHSHWNTMRVETVDFDSAEPKLTATEEAAVDALLAAVRDDVKQMSRRLESDGYAIIRAYNPGWFLGENTDKHDRVIIERRALPNGYTATLYIAPDEDYDCYESGDDVEDHKQVQAAVKGEWFVCDCVAVLRHDETGLEMGVGSLCGVTDDKSLVYVKTILEECLSDAISEAGEKVKQLAPPVKS